MVYEEYTIVVDFFFQIFLSILIGLKFLTPFFMKKTSSILFGLIVLTIVSCGKEPFKDSTKAYTDIHFLDEQNGFACFLNKIYKTNDGGKTWKTVVNLVDDSIIEIDFTDINHGWACTLKGKVLKFKN
jgi:hypothetical protein